MLCLVFALSPLDRTNISSAYIAGLEKDLKLDIGARYILHFSIGVLHRLRDIRAAIQLYYSKAGGMFYAGWRWIFIVEGIATVVFGILAIFYLCDFPDKAKFLSTREKRIAIARVRIDGSKKVYVHPTIEESLKVILDWKLAV